MNLVSMLLVPILEPLHQVYICALQKDRSLSGTEVQRKEWSVESELRFGGCELVWMNHTEAVREISRFRSSDRWQVATESTVDFYGRLSKCWGLQLQILGKFILGVYVLGWTSPSGEETLLNTEKCFQGLRGGKNCLSSVMWKCIFRKRPVGLFVPGRGRADMEKFSKEGGILKVDYHIVSHYSWQCTEGYTFWSSEVKTQLLCLNYAHFASQILSVSNNMNSSFL